MSEPIIYNGKIYERLTVDVSQPNAFAPPLVKEGDSGTRGFIVTVADNGQPLSIPTENTIVWLNCRNKSDPSKYGSSSGTINSDGTVTVDVPTCVMDAPGYIECDISINTASGNDTSILKSSLFCLNCEKAANKNGTSSQAEDSILAEISAGTVVPPAAPYVPKTRTVAGVDLQDDITAEELRGALGAMKREDILISSLNNATENGVLYYVYTESGGVRQYQHLVRCVSDANKRTQFMLTALSTAQAQANRFMYRQQEYDAENDSWGSWSSFSPVVPVPDAYTKAEIDNALSNLGAKVTTLPLTRYVDNGETRYYAEETVAEIYARMNNSELICLTCKSTESPGTQSVDFIRHFYLTRAGNYRYQKTLLAVSPDPDGTILFSNGDYTDHGADFGYEKTYYTKAEIDNTIGDIESLLAAI